MTTHKQASEENCYCVCHSPVSSCPFCEHCKGKYLKNLQAAHKQTSEELREYLENIELGVDDEGEPQFLDSAEIDGIMKAVRKRDKKRDAYIIGEDEPGIAHKEPSDYICTLCRQHPEKHTRNSLRAEQRKRSEEVI